MMQCRMCNRKYHHCTSCCSQGIPWEADGFCSGDCYYEWAQAEIERLTRELSAVAAQSEWRAQEIERLTRELEAANATAVQWRSIVSIYTQRFGPVLNSEKYE